jgi:copper chaperone CopZ
VMKQQFRIQGMHCVGCAMTVDGVLEDLPGVKSASTSYAQQIANIEYDESRIGEDELVEAVLKAGYTATLISDAKL